MRSTNSRTPSLRSWDFPLQGYKEPSLRMEDSLQCSQLLTIWHIPGFVGKLIKLWWPCALLSLAFNVDGASRSRAQLSSSYPSISSEKLCSRGFEKKWARGRRSLIRRAFTHSQFCLIAEKKTSQEVFSTALQKRGDESLLVLGLLLRKALHFRRVFGLLLCRASPNGILHTTWILSTYWRERVSTPADPAIQKIGNWSYFFICTD